MPFLAKSEGIRTHAFLMSLLALALATGFCLLTYSIFDSSNLIMIYLLATAWVATNFGRKEAIFTAVGGVLIFDFCFVAPRWTFAIADAQYAVTFVVMLVVGILISTLTLKRREQHLRAEREELRNILLSSVSHDLRTPLAAIAGSASVILDDSSLSHGSRELVKNISSEAARLGNIVRNILDLTKLESGDIALHRDWHSMEELVGTALERTSSLIAARPVKLDIPTDLPFLWADGLLLEQLLVNLFENIARHTDDTTLVEVTAKATSKQILLTVSDNGPGLPAGEELRIFERAFSANKSGGGVGLGLAICRAVAKAHGGLISATHRSGGGVSFVLELPRADSQPKVMHD